MSQLRYSTTERFDYLSGVGSGGCSDLDVLMERHGHFIIIENKRPDEELKGGQLYALRRLAAEPNKTVLVVRGTPPDDIISVGPLDGDQRPANATIVREMVQEWWDSH